MTQLILHTEYLLCSHECVLIPGLGGFLSHVSPAYYDGTTSTWYPPQKQITFNPGLFYNDGLLVSSYAEAYSMPVEEAFILVEKAVSELKKELKNNQSVTFGKIGELKYSNNGLIFFTPAKDLQYFSPETYGLQPVKIPLLEELKKTIITYEVDNTVEQKNQTARQVNKKPDTIYIPLKKKALYRSIAVASIVLLFMLFSTPIYVDTTHKTNYAKLLTPLINMEESVLMPKNSFEQPGFTQTTNDVIKEESTKEYLSEERINQITKDIIAATDEQRQMMMNFSEKQKEEKPEETVVPKNVEKPVTKAKEDALLPKKGFYYVVIGSFPTQKDAERYVAYAKGNGVKNVGIVIGKDSKRNRYRVYSGDFDNRPEAYQYMNLLTSTYKEHPNAWVHHEK